MHPMARKLHLHRHKKRRIADNKSAVLEFTNYGSVYQIVELRESMKPEDFSPGFYSDKPADLLLPKHLENMH